MCDACWDEAGRPQIQNARVRAAAESIGPVYQESPVGGNLHIVLDDWNVDDSDLDFCERDAENGLTAAERECIDLFRQLSVPERMSALALQDGMWAIVPAAV